MLIRGQFGKLGPPTSATGQNHCCVDFRRNQFQVNSGITIFATTTVLSHWEAGRAGPAFQVFCHLKTKYISTSSRSPLFLKVHITLMHEAVQRDLPLVVDGDGLFALVEKRLQRRDHDDWQPPIVGHRKTILSPNAAEFRRLWLAYRRIAPSTQ